jgi:hypothetical protein
VVCASKPQNAGVALRATSATRASIGVFRQSLATPGPPHADSTLATAPRGHNDCEAERPRCGWCDSWGRRPACRTPVGRLKPPWPNCAAFSGRLTQKRATRCAFAPYNCVGPWFGGPFTALSIPLGPAFTPGYATKSRVDSSPAAAPFTGLIVPAFSRGAGLKPSHPSPVNGADGNVVAQ